MGKWDALLPPKPEPPKELRRCDDCGKEGTDGFGSVITHTGESRRYCSICKIRRGLLYLFDPRSWSEIEQAMKGTAA